MVMPQMGESIAEATISKWLVKVGDKVEKDQTILEISTDKVDSEIPAPSAGIVTEIKYSEGAVVPVKQVIAIIDPSGKAEAKKVEAPSSSNGKAETKVDVSASDSKVLTPLVKELASQHGVALSDLEKLQGSGQGGRVTKEDFMAYLKQKESKPTPPTPPPAQSKPMVIDESDATIIPMDNMRAAIADHMVRSKHTSPHVYSIQEVDVSRVSAWRAKYKKEFNDKEGFSLSFTPFFLEAAVKGLQKFPLINSSVDGRRIIQKKHINLGCAVALGNSGLIVPVIKRAEERNLVGLARGLNDLALRARNKKLSPDDVAGGTFTVTNPGVFGTLIGTPIINQPQVAILCLGAISKRPVVINDMIGIREMCFLTLSYDHRIIDGSLGGQYLAFIREYLENWDMDRALY